MVQDRTVLETKTYLSTATATETATKTVALADTALADCLRGVRCKNLSSEMSSIHGHFIVQEHLEPASQRVHEADGECD